jgi:hypothetical protein
MAFDQLSPKAAAPNKRSHAGGSEPVVDGHLTLAKANVAIAERLEALNNRPFKKMEGSCSSLFEHLDRRQRADCGQRVAPFVTYLSCRPHLEGIGLI